MNELEKCLNDKINLLQKAIKQLDILNREENPDSIKKHKDLLENFIKDLNDTDKVINTYNDQFDLYNMKINKINLLMKTLRQKNKLLTHKYETEMNQMSKKIEAVKKTTSKMDKNISSDNSYYFNEKI